MNYKLKYNLTHSPEDCLVELLTARGVENIEGYMNPSKEYELDPYLLDNISEAADLLFKHLENDSSILIVQDADTDGICSAAMMWLYIKDFYPKARLEYVCHEHKAHGLDDIIEDVIESDYDLIILPDASSFDIEEHKRLQEVGKEVLVLDHHHADSYSPYAVVI